jgi:zinc transporter ZupT
VTKPIWEKIDRAPFGIKFVVAMLVYLALSSLLESFLSRPWAQGLALPLVSVASYPFLSESRTNSAKHLIYSISGGMLIFVVLKIVS